MTFREYLQFEPPPGFRDELIHGEVILSPSASRKHAEVCHALSRLLEARLRPGFVVRLDTTHRLGASEGPRPDVFAMRTERWIAADETGGYPEGSPELAIEVLSPSNDEREMETKRELYFPDARCLEVWEVDTARQIVLRYRRDGATRYRMDDSLAMPEELGHGSISVRSIFAGIVS